MIDLPAKYKNNKNNPAGSCSHWTKFLTHSFSALQIKEGDMGNSGLVPVGHLRHLPQKATFNICSFHLCSPSNFFFRFLKGGSHKLDHFLLTTLQLCPDLRTQPIASVARLPSGSVPLPHLGLKALPATAPVPKHRDSPWPQSLHTHSSCFLIHTSPRPPLAWVSLTMHFGVTE